MKKKNNLTIGGCSWRRVVRSTNASTATFHGPEKRWLIEETQIGGFFGFSFVGLKKVLR
ncbi:hypothetical protein HS088_TW14G00063 [Tripterygium wilfordii]|uniref:Uncharacterized protein n=1 Tax=Tripterygium wilfordii TaxID=458696 RepID=A0A7J7CPB5_TRIWF|nr:hypothetical protein HS088_TW14G00063 [Tripterygium wilfordii]